MDLWVAQGKQIEDMGAHSICIKDMAGLLKPYEAFELVKRLKKSTKIPIHLHCHATTGLSVGTCPSTTRVDSRVSAEGHRP